MSKSVYIVSELHADCPKIRGVFEDKDKANEIAYKDTEYWRNVFLVELNKEL